VFLRCSPPKPVGRNQDWLLAANSVVSCMIRYVLLARD
jgi:hypothetical protein